MPDLWSSTEERAKREQERAARIRKLEEEKTAVRDKCYDDSIIAVLKELDSRGVDYSVNGNKVYSRDTSIIFTKSRVQLSGRNRSNVHWQIMGVSYYHERYSSPNRTKELEVSIKGIDFKRVVDQFVSAVETSDRNKIANARNLSQREVAKKTLKEAADLLKYETVNKDGCIYGSFHHYFKGELKGQSVRISECESKEPSVTLDLSVTFEQFKKLMEALGEITCKE